MKLLHRELKHSHNTRRKSDLQLPKPKWNLGKRIFKYSGTVLFNSRPPEIKSLDSLAVVGTGLSRRFLEIILNALCI